MKFYPLKILKEYGGTQIILGKDLEKGIYLIQKKLTTKDRFANVLFNNEKRILKKIKHEKIINTIKILGETEDGLSFFLEYAEYGNLKTYIQKNKTTPIKKQFLVQIASALCYIHKAGYVHNDLNLTNILITDKIRCKIADFAFSGKIGEQAFPCRPEGVIIGTEQYCYKQITVHEIKNDIFAFGKLLYELISENFENQSNPDFNKIKNKRLRETIEKCLNHEITSMEEILKTITKEKDFS